MKLGNRQSKLVLAVIASLVIFGLSENAHAIVPVVVSAQITGPNTITVTYSIPVISAQADYTNLVLNPGGARAITGHVGSGTSTITLTFGGAAAPPGTTATIDINGGALNVREAAFPNDPLVDVIGQVVSNGQGEPGTGEKCSADCTKPTLGMTENGDMLVENGFTYNGNAVNVNSFYTHYPLITAEVGRENIASFKIYEDGGPKNIRHFALAFGIGHGKIFSDSKAIIEWDKSWNGKETLNIIDPENSLDNVRITAFAGSCKTTDFFGKDCLIINIYHTFRQPLDFNIVSTYYWDAQRNAANNYFNDGIKIQGDSLNTPKQYQVIHMGKSMTITETGKNTAIDEYGNTWTFDIEWKMDYVPQVKIDEGLTSKGIDRNNVKFNTYKKGQELIANYNLETSADGSRIQSKTLDAPKSFDYSYISRADDTQLKNLLEYEKDRVNSLYADQFVVSGDDEFAKYWSIYEQYYGSDDRQFANSWNIHRQYYSLFP